jgi:hypothetical protein
MKTLLSSLFAVVLGLGLGGTELLAQTDGGAKLEVTLLDYNGTGTAHYTVAWVTTASGTFIKSLRKQGPTSWTSSQWTAHCPTWNSARAGSTVLDGYTSATAPNYSGTNSPVILTWNCRDASNNLVPDADYRFWVQYAENERVGGQDVPGPFATGGLLWTKGPTGATTTYLNQGANFSNMKVTWTPTSVPQNTAPVLTVPADQTISELAPYTANATATDADLPAQTLTFALVSGPSGLTVSPSGAIAWRPTEAQGPSVNLVEVKVTDNGSPALSVTNSFTLTVSGGVVAPTISSIEVTGGNVVVRGTGPANGTYEVLTSTDIALPSAQWVQAGTGSFDSSGNFSVTVPVSAGVSQSFTKLRVP